jgi:hypothetical protein
MLKRKPPQTSFYRVYLYDRIVPQDHLLRKIDQTVDFSFVRDLVRDRYREDFGRPAEDPEFMLRLCLLQYLYGDSDRQVVATARVNLAYKYFLGLAVDEDVPDDTTVTHLPGGARGHPSARFSRWSEIRAPALQQQGLPADRRAVAEIRGSGRYRRQDQAGERNPHRFRSRSGAGRSPGNDVAPRPVRRRGETFGVGVISRYPPDVCGKATSV